MSKAKESAREGVLNVLRANAGEVLEGDLIRIVSDQTGAEEDTVKDALEDLEHEMAIFRSSVDGMVELA